MENGNKVWFTSITHYAQIMENGTHYIMADSFQYICDQISQKYCIYFTNYQQGAISNYSPVIDFHRLNY